MHIPLFVWIVVPGARILRDYFLIHLLGYKNVVEENGDHGIDGQRIQHGPGMRVEPHVRYKPQNQQLQKQYPAAHGKRQRIHAFQPVN